MLAFFPTPGRHGEQGRKLYAGHGHRFFADCGATRGILRLIAAERIAVVRALHGLGDMLCAVPALSALRSAYPRSHISLIGLPACGWLLERFGNLFDALLPFPGFPGIPEAPHSPGALAAFLERVRSSPFDLALQMHGSGTVSNAFTAMLGARACAGFYERGGYRPEGSSFYAYPAIGSEIHRWLHLTDCLDLPAGDDRLAFPVSAADRRALRAHPALKEIAARRFVCVHAGARDAARRWPAARFAEVADALAARGYSVVLTGTAAEREAADAVIASMGRRGVNVAGETSLGVLAALLERCALLVTNDTGISHLAAALRTPSVVIFLASDPDRWAPLDRARHRPIVARGLGARVIEGSRVSDDDVPRAREVLAEATGLLEGGVRDAS